jgi:bifunctional DNA-binding transcriptional regulator/antitoxin component of YhaV-PrlF toxin-antitoxin module
MATLETHRMRDVVRNLSTKSEKIRALDDAGFERADIARFLDIRYQHVRNVLVAKRPTGRVVAMPLRSPAAAPIAEEPKARSKAKIQIGAGGRIVIPSEMRTAMGVAEGDTVLARVIDGEFRLLSQQAALRRAQKLVRQFVPEGTRLVDQLLEDRRAEAKKEAGE